MLRQVDSTVLGEMFVASRGLDGVGFMNTTFGNVTHTGGKSLNNMPSGSAAGS